MSIRSRTSPPGQAHARSGTLATVVLAVLGPAACTHEPEPSPWVESTHHQPAPVDDRGQLGAYVAQCEAVLGEVPEIRCDGADPAPGTTVHEIPVFVDGRLLGFDGEPSPEERALLEERERLGDYTCDFPSLGGDFPCAVGSTLVHAHDPESPHVQWVALCRGVPEDALGYDRFTDVGLIGHNTQTGETCFFFARDEGEPLDELPPLVGDPGVELDPWQPPGEMPGSCISCHPNNDPWILTPWLMPGYMRDVLVQLGYDQRLPPGVALDDVMAARDLVTTPFALQRMLPEPLPPGRTAWTEEEIVDDQGDVLRRQYRIVGSSYVRAEAEGRVAPRMDHRPDSWSVGFRERIRLAPQDRSCSKGCHALGNEHWLALAGDALGRPLEGSHRTGYPEHVRPGLRWMPPGSQDDATVDADALTLAAITPCPIPRRVDDEPEVEVIGVPGVAVQVTWVYANDFGQVPGRDDVRFDVAFGPADALALASGTSPTSEREGVRLDAAPGVVVLRDLAPMDDEYQVTLPLTAAHGRMRIALQPKRFCFEEPEPRPFAYAPPRWLEVEGTSPPR